MQLHQKRQSSFNAQKEPEKTSPFSNANTSVNANNDDNSQTAPTPKKRMILDAPVPEPISEESMNVLIQGIKINSNHKHA
jgi:hypothetical protein